MTQQSILITGCSSGIGYDAAHAMKDAGWRVFASCRQAKDCEKMRALGFDSPLIDYSDAETIVTGLAETLEATGGTLDALFNNGAFACPGAVEDVPTAALREIFETNLFGWHELTRLVLPVMRAQGHGRIVNCSSVLGFVGFRWRGAYVATKYALEGLTDVLRLEMADTNIRVSLIEPGPITTKFRDNAAKHFEKWIDWKNSARRDAYQEELDRLYKQAGPGKYELPPSAVSKKLLHAVTSPRPRGRYYVTTPTYLMGFLKRVLSTRWLDFVLTRG